MKNEDIATANDTAMLVEVLEVVVVDVVTDVPDEVVPRSTARVIPVLAVDPCAIRTHLIDMVSVKVVSVAEVTETVAHVEVAVCVAQPIAGLPVVVNVTVIVEEGVTVNRHPVYASVGAERKSSAVAATVAVASAFVRLPSHLQYVEVYAAS